MIVLIELKDVTLKYSKRFLGGDMINLTIPTGEIVGILGENGSGKTTLLKSIMGLKSLFEGEIKMEGESVMKQYDKISFITEEGSYIPDMTPIQYATFLGDFFPYFKMDKFIQLLEYFEIPRHRKIKTFSRGMKSKVEICAGFSKGAKYIVMDEPFLGKDIFTRRDFLKMMVSSLQADETILISTHLIDEIENVIDRAIVLQGGRIKGNVYIDELREEGNTLESYMEKIANYKQDKYTSLSD